MKNVFLVTKPLSAPFNDGTKVLTRNLVSGAINFRPIYFTMKGDTSPPIGCGTPIDIFSDEGYVSAALGDKLKVSLTLLTKDQPDVYHYIFTPTWGSLQVMKTIMKLKGTAKTVLTLTTLPEKLSMLNNLSTTLVTTSEHSKALLEREGLKDVRMIYPGVDPNRVKELADKPLPPDINNEPFLLYAGDWNKDTMESLLNILKRLSDLHTPVKLVISARVKSNNDLNLKSAFETQVKGEGTLADRVSIVDVDNVLPLVKAAKALFMPLANLKDKLDMPMVILEALSMGKPVFLSDAPTLKELHELDSSATVLHSNTNDLVYDVKKVIDSCDREDELSSRAKELFAKHFRASEMVAQYEQLYEELTGN